MWRQMRWCAIPWLSAGVWATQAQDTEHSNTKMHTKLEAAEAKEAQARAELAELRGQLHAQARENGTLQAEICELKRALAVRAPETRLTAAAAETHDAMSQHPILLSSCVRAVRTDYSRQDIYLRAGARECAECSSLLLALLLRIMQQGHANVMAVLHVHGCHLCSASNGNCCFGRSPPDTYLCARSGLFTDMRMISTTCPHAPASPSDLTQCISIVYRHSQIYTVGHACPPVSVAELSAVLQWQSGP